MFGFFPIVVPCMLTKHLHLGLISLKDIVNLHLNTPLQFLNKVITKKGLPPSHFSMKVILVQEQKPLQRPVGHVGLVGFCLFLSMKWSEVGLYLLGCSLLETVLLSRAALGKHEVMLLSVGMMM